MPHSAEHTPAQPKNDTVQPSWKKRWDRLFRVVTSLTAAFTGVGALTGGADAANHLPNREPAMTAVADTEEVEQQEHTTPIELTGTVTQIRPEGTPSSDRYAKELVSLALFATDQLKVEYAATDAEVLTFAINIERPANMIQIPLSLFSDAVRGDAYYALDFNGTPGVVTGPQLLAQIETALTQRGLELSPESRAAIRSTARIQYGDSSSNEVRFVLELPNTDIVTVNTAQSASNNKNPAATFLERPQFYILRHSETLAFTPELTINEFSVVVEVDDRTNIYASLEPVEITAPPVITVRTVPATPGTQSRVIQVNPAPSTATTESTTAPIRQKPITVQSGVSTQSVPSRTVTERPAGASPSIERQTVNDAWESNWAPNERIPAGNWLRSMVEQGLITISPSARSTVETRVNNWSLVPNPQEFWKLGIPVIGNCEAELRALAESYPQYITIQPQAYESIPHRIGGLPSDCTIAAAQR